MTLRPHPHNVELEQQLLGALLINNDVMHAIEFLKPQHFYEPMHGRIFDVTRKLIDAGRRATPTSLKHALDDEPPIGQHTVVEYLGLLAASAVSWIAVPDFAKSIHELFVRRQMIEMSEQLIERAFAWSEDVSADGLIEEAETQLSSLAEKGVAHSHLIVMPDALTEAVNMIASAYQRDGRMIGISTGLRDLDRITGGLAAGELIIAAGRPSMGKSALAAGIAHYNAKRFVETRDTDDPQGCAVAFFTLEMSAVQLVLRLISRETDISAHVLRRGAFEQHQFDHVIDASQRLADLPIYFDETGALSVQSLCGRARRLKRKHEIGLIVVDYLQLLSSVSQKRQQSVQEQVAEVTSRLKALAKELNVPVLALSQLSRVVETRDDKRPQLSDLRDSGAIEQDADVVMFVFREEYYHARKQPEETSARFAEWKLRADELNGKAELIIAKQRQGPTSNVAVHFNTKLTRFSDLSRQEGMSFIGQ
jgi:replicative DNA helicase